MFLRDAQGHLTGALLETAAFVMIGAMPKPDEAHRLAALDVAQQRYFAKGYTHAQDGATMTADLPFMTGAAVRERLKRSDERRVGKECVSTGRSRWPRIH